VRIDYGVEYSQRRAFALAQNVGLDISSVAGSGVIFERVESESLIQKRALRAEAVEVSFKPGIYRRNMNHYLSKVRTLPFGDLLLLLEMFLQHRYSFPEKNARIIALGSKAVCDGRESFTHPAIDFTTGHRPTFFLWDSNVTKEGDIFLCRGYTEPVE
jgi:hypothetical protein